VFFFCLAGRDRCHSEGVRVCYYFLLGKEDIYLPNFYREGEDPELIVKKHINLLHRYNEAKDATQVLIGRVCIYTADRLTPVDNDIAESWRR